MVKRPLAVFVLVLFAVVLVAPAVRVHGSSMPFNVGIVKKSIVFLYYPKGKDFEVGGLLLGESAGDLCARECEEFQGGAKRGRNGRRVAGPGECRKERLVREPERSRGCGGDSGWLNTRRTAAAQ